METKGAFGRRLCFLVPGETEQIVGRERRGRVSQLLGAADGALIRAAASTQPLAAFMP